MRGFEVVTKYKDRNINLPKRATKNSAGYDIEAAERVVIKPGEIKLVSTGLKAYMNDDEVMYLYDRSSNPKKRGIVLSNSVGVIDSDYYNNEANEGHFKGQFTNITDHDVVIEKGDKIMQAVFSKFLKVDDDSSSGIRKGGFGSTSSKKPFGVIS